MTHPDRLQQRIDSYLAQLRRSLGELPQEEVNEILREIRSHILERAESTGELTEERLVAILKALGTPDEIAPLYQADAVMAKARTSLSPTIVMRGVHRWSMLSAKGLILYVIGIVGYATAFALILAGLTKIFAPGQVGAWVGPGANFNIGTNSDPGAREILGWWLIPVGLVGGSALVVATTRILRWVLRFARIQRPTAG